MPESRREQAALVAAEAVAVGFPSLTNSSKTSDLESLLRDRLALLRPDKASAGWRLALQSALPPKRAVVIAARSITSFSLSTLEFLLSNFVVSVAFTDFDNTIWVGRRRK